MTARSCYTSDDYDRFHRSADIRTAPPYIGHGERNMALYSSNASRPDLRSYPVTRQGRNLPAREPEPEASNGQPRRRIAVAVSVLKLPVGLSRNHSGGSAVSLFRKWR